MSQANLHPTFGGRPTHKTLPHSLGQSHKRPSTAAARRPALHLAGPPRPVVATSGLGGATAVYTNPAAAGLMPSGGGYRSVNMLFH